MCQDKLHDFLAELPKCEHHMHVEGSLTPELLLDLAAKNKVQLPADDDAAFASAAALRERYARFSSLDDFLAYYYVGFRVLQTADDFAALAHAYLAKAHAQRVRHAEVFFDPQAHTARGVSLATVVEGLSAAARRAEAELGMSVLLVPCFLRHLPVAESEDLFAQMRDGGYFERGELAGVGMDSSELPFPPERFAALFGAVRDAGVRRTAHVCEEGPPSYLPAALDLLHLQRVDHGVRAAEDAAVLARLARERVMLTVCPLSNVALKGFPSVADVPIRKMLEAGVRFSINSDDPAYFGGWVQENYCAVQEAHGLTVQEWARVAGFAVEGSWCDDERKKVLAGEVDAVVARWS